MSKGKTRQEQRRRIRKAMKKSDIMQISGRILGKFGYGSGVGRHAVVDRSNNNDDQQIQVTNNL